MPRNGSGSYSLPQPPFVSNTTISSAAVNADLSDIANTLTNSVSADGQTTLTGQLQGFAGTSSTPGYAFSGGTNTGFYAIAGGVGASVSGVQVATLTSAGWTNAGLTGNAPVGAVMDFAGSTAPSGWRLCFGQAVSRTTFASLFAAIGTTYGVGDGSTTFNLPDCRGRSTFGQDNMGGSAANRITSAGGNFDGTTLGNTGGQQNKAILQTHLPAISPGITITDPGHKHSPLGGGNFVTDVAATIATAGSNSVAHADATTASATTGITAAFTSSLGSGTALPTLSNAIIFNKIIFAGV
jgi:microcystin-dependent protein